MPECKFCKVEITWIEKVPYEAEIDHRLICQGVNMSTEQAARAAHERRVRQFFRASSNATSQMGSKAQGKSARSKRSG